MGLVRSVGSVGAVSPSSSVLPLFFLLSFCCVCGAVKGDTVLYLEPIVVLCGGVSGLILGLRSICTFVFERTQCF